jgi:hypothetical protein
MMPKLSTLTKLSILDTSISLQPTNHAKHALTRYFRLSEFFYLKSELFFPKLPVLP